MAEYKDRILLSFIVLLCMHEKEKEAMTPAWYSKKTQKLLACEWSVGARVCFLPIVCVCMIIVCVWEREAERERAHLSLRALAVSLFSVSQWGD